MTEQNDSIVYKDSNGNVFLESGKIGIGKSNPYYSLEVITNHNLEHFTWLQFGWATDWKDGAHQHNQRINNPYGAGYTGDINEPISIWCESGLRAFKIFISSDKRIKTDFSLISDDTALRQVNQLESYEYHYIDPERRKPMKTIGFIAQEVKEVIPNAVTLEKNYIPDEMRIIENTKWTNIGNEKYKLTIDDIDISGNHTGMCRFYVSDDISGNNVTIKEIMIDDDKQSFTFDKKWNNVFIYGKEVDDFHTIDKAQIFALHHSAIQELSRQNDAKDLKIQVLETENNNKSLEIKELKEKIQGLEIENKELKEKLQTMEADMALVKQKLGL